MDTKRRGIAATRKSAPSTLLGPVLPAAPTFTSPSPRTSTCLASFPFASPLTCRSRTIHRSQWTAGDLTGRFPIPSTLGHEYLLILLNHNYIHYVPMTSRAFSSYVSAFRSACVFFSSHSLPITQLILDNETSADLTVFFRQQFPPFSFQHVPPQNHRTNPVERAIRTAKNHFIVVLASAHVTFPPARWHLLLPITELTLYHMRGFSLDPTISAWHGLKGLPLDFSASPIHPPGQLVVVHDSPTKRKSWAHSSRQKSVLPWSLPIPLSLSFRLCPCHSRHSRLRHPGPLPRPPVPI